VSASFNFLHHGTDCVCTCRYQKTLLELEEAAKANKKGVFQSDSESAHARVHIEKPFKIRGPEEGDEEEEAFFDATQAYKEWREHTLDGMYHLPSR